MNTLPQRIVCLTTETVEVIYMLGEQDRLVGISGYTTRPKIARKEKPKVSAFTSAKIDKILELQPDLVLGFSNLQSDIAAALIKACLEVHVFNQRSIADILRMILTTGRLLGVEEKSAKIVDTINTQLTQARAIASSFKSKPKVYFEEWDEPMMCSIRWASELIEVAGGEDCFPELAAFHSATDRIVSPAQVVSRQPDIIIASWCGKKFRPERMAAREGWGAIPAIQNNQVFEIKSVDILQPGPSVFEHGLPQLSAIMQEWHRLVD